MSEEDERSPQPEQNHPTLEAKAVGQNITSNEEIITGEVAEEPGQGAGPDLQAAQRLARVPTGALGLFPGDSQEPILYTGPEKAVLGRASLPQTASTIDLTPFDATDLGVSRRHAAIALSGNQYLLEDLGSLNGTWLHDARLPLYVQRPLQSGDVFRLGQLNITVYFHSTSQAAQPPAAKPQAQPQKGQPEAAPDETLGLSMDAEELTLAADGHAVVPGQQVTPGFLANTLAPYLASLEHLQSVIDSMQGTPGRNLAVLQMQAVPRITMIVSGAGDAARLARTLIARWRQKHTLDIELLLAAQGGQAEAALSVEQTVALEVSQAELTAEILAKVGSKLPPADLAGYAKQLIEPVKALLLSPVGVEMEEQ